jgi:hypothetical protein
MGTYQLRALLCKVVKLEDSDEPWSPPLAKAFNSNVAKVQEWVR